MSQQIQSRARPNSELNNGLQKSNELICELCHYCIHLSDHYCLLPVCHHTICNKCLNHWLPEYSLSLVCPVCLDLCIVPKEGVVAFDPNFIPSLCYPETMDQSFEHDSGVDTNTTQHDISVQILICGQCQGGDEVRWRCLTCNNITLCKNCITRHTRPCASHKLVECSDLNSGSPVCSPGHYTNSSHSTSGPTWSCIVHPRMDVRLYCGDCRTVICDECVDTSYTHSSHIVVLLKEGLLQVQNQKNRALHKLYESLGHKRPDDSEEQILQKKTVTELAEAFRRKRDNAQERYHQEQNETQKEFLVKEVDFWNRRTVELLNECQSNAYVLCVTETDPGKPSSSFLSSEERSHPCEDSDVLQKSSSIDSAEDMSSLLFYPFCIRLLENFLERFSSDKKALSSTVDLNYTAHGEGLRYCCIDKRTAVILSNQHKDDKLVTNISDIEAGITSKSGTEQFPADVIRISESSFEIAYTLPYTGTFYLSIQIHQNHIRGSPFTIRSVQKCDYSVDHCSIHSKSKSTDSHSSECHYESVKRTAFGIFEDDLVLKVGKRGRGLGQFTNPQDLCCMANGNIVATDSTNQRIQVFTDEGRCILKFGLHGREPGHIRRPTGVAPMTNDRIVVADYDNRCLHIFDTNGHFHQRFYMGKFLGPKGVAVDSMGRFVVVDNKASLVYVLHASGKLSHKFGTRGNKPHQLAGPHYVAIGTGQKTLYVSDFHHHCVKVFDIDSGEHLFSFGTNGTGNGQFNAPTGIAVDESSNVLVADWGNSRIQVFDQNGSFLSHVNSAADPLYGPQGLTLTADGCVAVADSGNHCYKIYRYLL